MRLFASGKYGSKIIRFYFKSLIRTMVQGEDMGKRKKKFGAGTLPVFQLFSAGFLGGILIPNIIWKMEWRQKTLASLYLLGTFVGKGIEGYDYFLYVLKMRGSIFLIVSLSGISVFGVPLSVLGAVCQGLEIGMLLTMSILQFGMAGGLAGLGLLLPQYILYIPSMFYLFSVIYLQSMEIWKNKGLLSKRIYWYFSQVFVSGIMFFGGILLEVYCNPWLFQLLTKNSYFF